MNVLLYILSNRYVLGGVLVTALSGFLYIKFSLMQRHIEDLESEIRAKTSVIETQKTTIKNIKKDYESIIKSQSEMRDEVEKLRDSNEDLKKKLYRENEGKKPIGELARKKAKLIENIINNASEEVWDCFESISRGDECG